MAIPSCSSCESVGVRLHKHFEMLGRETCTFSMRDCNVRSWQCCIFPVVANGISPRPSQHVSCLLWHVTTAVQLMEQIGEWSALDSRTQFLLNTSPSPPALTCASKHHNNKTWTNASELTHAALVVKFVRSMFRCT